MENYNKTLSIISKIHSLSSSFLKKELEEKGLKELVSSHGNILFQLSVSEQLSMTEIASRIHRDKSTTTVLVKKLEKEGSRISPCESTGESCVSVARHG